MRLGLCLADSGLPLADLGLPLADLGLSLADLGLPLPDSGLPLAGVYRVALYDGSISPSISAFAGMKG